MGTVDGASEEKGLSMRVEIPRKTQSYLDFTQGLKVWNLRQSGPRLRESYERDEQTIQSAGGEPPKRWQDVRPLLEPKALYRFDRYVARVSQEMMWRGLSEAFASRAEDLGRSLEAEDGARLGRLELDPNVDLPDYYRNVEFHIRPGSYWNGDHQGWLTEGANWIYFSGQNDQRGQQYGSVDMLRKLVPDLHPARIIDLACGIGQSTWPLKEAWPAADVVGIDLSAPLLKYAHRVATDLGLDITFSQQAAERTNYDGESFELVFAYILFHELPAPAAKAVAAEAFRLLKRGGWFCIADVQPYSDMTPYRACISDWQTANNGEPYWRTWGLTDRAKLLTGAGFHDYRFAHSSGPNITGIWTGQK